MKHKARIVEYILFAIIVVLTVIGLDKVLSWKDTSGEYLSSYKQLYATDDNLIDVVFTGSSHCYCGVYPAVLWKEAGISAFDMAVSGQDLNSTYHSLKELLKTQSPKVVYVDMYGSTFERLDKNTGNEYRNYLSMKISKNYFDNINGYFPEDERKDYYLRFPIIHTRYKELRKYDFITKENNNFGRGEYFVWESWEQNVNHEPFADTECAELSEREVKWLEDMVNLSKENNFELVFMVLPYSASVADQRKFNAIKAYSEENNIRFIDFNSIRDEIGLEDSTDIIDGGHINAYGAQKVTAYLEKDMQIYNLADHRGDEAYKLWDEDVQYYERLNSRHLLATVGDPMVYSTELAKLSDTVTVISVEHAYADNAEWYFEMLEPFGMDYSEFLEGGKWIYRNGTLTKVANNVMGEPPFVMKLNQYDVLRVSYYGDLERTNIMVNKTSYLKNDGNITIFTYDQFTDDVLDVRYY